MSLLFYTQLIYAKKTVSYWHDGSVDPVSLAESLRDVHDERVQGEIEDYLEGLTW